MSSFGSHSPYVGTIGSADIKVDLYRSDFTLGVEDFYDDRAIRRGIITGNVLNDGTGNALADAARAVMVHLGEFHPGDGSEPSFIQPLPAVRIRTERWGPTKAWFQIYYARTRNNRHIHPAVQSDRFTVSYEPTIVYREPGDIDGNPIDGFPAGPIYGQQDETNPNERPRGWIWKRPAIRFTVPTRINFNPLGAPFNVAEFEQTTNITPILFDTLNFAPNVVRFDGATVRWNYSGFGSRYVVFYHFTAVKYGWVKQVPRWDGAQWTTELVQEFFGAWGGANFPVHY